MVNGKLIVIEAGDGCGKRTQTNLLYDALLDKGLLVRKVSFPDYSSPSSSLVKMYLAGEFGNNADALSAYPASLFYTVDRVASFYKEWRDFYLNGGIIIADRYTTSNLVHQAAKMSNVQERRDFVEWLNDLEYNKCALPKPDLVIYLNLPPDLAQELIVARNRIDAEGKLDIHERDKNYLKQCWQCGLWLAEQQSWQIIDCLGKQKTLKPAPEIHDTILSEVMKAQII